MKLFHWHLSGSEVLLALIIVGCTGYLGTLGYGATSQWLQGPPQFEGARAMVHAEEQVALGPRITGRPASFTFRKNLREHLTLNGWSIFEHEFEAGDGATGRNVVAFQGTGPTVILGAHYDTRIWADEDPDPSLRRLPVTGANDAASGTAVLMELARVLDVEATAHTVCLVFFDAEDNGNIPGWSWIMGSSAFAADRAELQACGDPRAVVIVDMVGDRQQEFYLEQTGNVALNDAIWSVAEDLGYAAWFRRVPGYHMIDDHTPFLRAGIPAITVIDFDYPYWHTTADTLDKIDADSLQRVGRVMQTWLENGAEFNAGSN